MKRISLYMLIPAIFWMMACDDILEQDIEDSKVVLVAPGDSVSLQQSEVTFLWEPVNGAGGYLLQVVSPSFTAPAAIRLDTFVLANRFTYSLPAGAYSWRVSAENSAYYTPYFYRSFTVLDSTDHKATVQGLSLLSPANAHVTANSAVKFSWNKHPDVEEYMLKISGAADISAYLKDTVVSLNLTAFDDTLRWQVFGITPEGQLRYHAPERWLFIDKEPAAVKLSAPAADLVFAPDAPIDFAWEASTAPDLKHYLFSLYDAATGQPVDGFEPLEINETEKTLFGLGDSLPVGQYLWEIKTVDRLGNMSTVGMEKRAFEIRE
jgi:hypothetical protein